MKHVISALVKNEVGVTAHIAGLFAARAYNIDSFTGSETENPDISRITVVVSGDDTVIQQVINQLSKLINVIEVTDLSAKPFVERDLMLIKITTNPDGRHEVIDLVKVFRGRIVDLSHDDMTVELSGPEAKIEAFIALCRPYGIKECIRSGIIAITRGNKNQL